MFGYEPEYIDCGDARIACYDIGRGHPLILLHGNGEDSSYWNAQISEFTRFMRVIAVDSRGHGASDSGTKGLSFDLMAQEQRGCAVAGECCQLYIRLNAEEHFHICAVEHELLDHVRPLQRKLDCKVSAVRKAEKKCLFDAFDIQNMLEILRHQIKGESL